MSTEMLRLHGMLLAQHSRAGSIFPFPGFLWTPGSLLSLSLCSATPHGSGPWINILPMNTTIHYPPDN